ncbi:hypothetical protein N0G65_003539 [Providencia rettgeri]|nr:hypothetical protein [Providencia rettgeri]
MKRTLAAIALAVLITGCDSKPDAPFGLKWGQSMDSVSFIKDGDCNKDGDETICVFNNAPPFNDWSYENTLKFKSDKLVEVRSVLNAVDDKKYFCALLSEESKFLAGEINDGEKLSDAAKNCTELESKSDAMEGFGEKFNSKKGIVDVYLGLDPYVGIITYSPPEK